MKNRKEIINISISVLLLISLYFTSKFYQDFATEERLDKFVWFSIAVAMDIMKAFSGGVLFYTIATYKQSKESEASKKIVLFFSVIIFSCTLILSISGSIGALMLGEQQRNEKNFLSSTSMERLKKIEKSKNENEKQIKKIINSLNSLTDRNKNLSDKQIKNREGIENQIAKEKEKLSNYRDRISTAIRNKKGHSTLDRFKRDAENEIDRLNGSLKGIDINITSGESDLIKEKERINKENEKLSIEKDNIESGKSILSKNTNKKTAVELVWRENSRKGEVFISIVLELLILFLSFMRYREMGLEGNTITRKIDKKIEEVKEKIENKKDKIIFENRIENYKDDKKDDNKISLRKEIKFKKLSLNGIENEDLIISYIEKMYETSKRDKDNNLLSLGIEKMAKILEIETETSRSIRRLLLEKNIIRTEGKKTLIIAERNDII
jgi:hypothetical protein